MSKLDPASSGPRRIGKAVLPEAEQQEWLRQRELPIKVLQIGEGNFLRGFADWMLQACNRRGLLNGSVAVTQPRPTGKPHLDKLKEQQGAYTLLVRGLRDGRPVEEKETITVFSRMVDPYGEWEAFLELAELPELEFVISNTTEAGLVYQPSEWSETVPVLSYPGKLTAFLYRRFARFGGDPARGLIHLPCELLERNGERLSAAVLRHAEDWGLPEAFRAWVRDANRFLNTLVDRIVTGYPEDADALFGRWGYADPLLTTAEPYYFWAIQGERELEERLPLAQAGLNVKWVEDLTPYQLRKVRLLNGAHTILATIGLVKGLREVREALEHPELGPRLMQGLFEEIVPAVPLDRGELTAYANETLDRFRNPYMKHRLADIALNSLSKWKTRLLPTLKAHWQRTGDIPDVLAESLAGLLRLYRPADAADPNSSLLPDGSSFAIRDDQALLELIRAAWAPYHAGGGAADRLANSVNQVLALTAVWDEDLTRYPGLADAVARHLAGWEAGAR